MIIDCILIIIIFIQWILIMRNRDKMNRLQIKVDFLSDMSSIHGDSIRKLYELGNETTRLMNTTVNVLKDMAERR